MTDEIEFVFKLCEFKNHNMYYLLVCITVEPL